MDNFQKETAIFYLESNGKKEANLSQGVGLNGFSSFDS
jgi:hypothetical protein